MTGFSKIVTVFDYKAMLIVMYSFVNANYAIVWSEGWIYYIQNNKARKFSSNT